ncbi:MAG: glycosyltransferase [Xanthobacteraceae bacterium]|nr:glycosyltransferase [Xanthobacteraceae bacterium]
MLEALSPGLLALGFCLLILPWLNSERSFARAAMVIVAFLLLTRYFVWRSTDTVPALGWNLDFAIGIVFFAAEAMSLLAGQLNLVFLSRFTNRTPEVEANKAWLAAQPSRRVDVFICTYNEEAAILERTMIGATGLNYENYRVWVLDDGRRPWLRQMAESLGCRYLTRPDNAGAKAGNINHALAYVAQLPDPPEFVAILDADFVPMPEFLSRAMCLFRDETVGIVQTPQHFINPDPIQTNLDAARVWPDEQRLFFDVLMPAKDAWGAAFCCGTSSVIRFAPLMRIGGFPTDSVTEDYLVTLRMKEIGSHTIYLNERLTVGLAPEGLKEYITQRGRWCLGFMQIVRGRSGPLSLRSRLTFIDRLSLIDSFLHWTSIYPVKLLGLVVPSLYLLFGIRAVDANLHTLLAYFLPFFIWHSLTITWLSKGRSLAIMSDVAQYIAAPAIVKAVATGLLKPQGHKFKVTAKGGDRGQRFVEWRLFRFYASALAINLAGIVVAFLLYAQGDSIAYGDLALAWSWYNAIVLLLVCLVCIEQPRRRKAERFETDEAVQVVADGRPQIYRLADISITGARFRGDMPGPIGTRVKCTLRGQAADAMIVRPLPGGFAVKFDESLNARIDMIRNFYAGDYIAAFHAIEPAGVGKAVLSRIFR